MPEKIDGDDAGVTQKRLDSTGAYQMPSRHTHRSARRVEERRDADVRSRTAAVRAFPHRRGAPRVCPSCGRPDDLFTRLRVGRQNMYGPLMRFLQYMLDHDSPSDEILAAAEWPLLFACRQLGIAPPTFSHTPTPTARGERVTATGVTLKRAA